MTGLGGVKGFEPSTPTSTPAADNAATLRGGLALPFSQQTCLAETGRSVRQHEPGPQQRGQTASQALPRDQSERLAST